MQKRINRTPLQSEIMKYIQEYIEENQLVAGDKLPSQSQLMNMMGVSMTSLREAVKTLEAKNILEVINGKGAYVKDNFASALSSHLGFIEEKEMLLEAVEARKILEKEIIKLTINHITETEIEILGEVVKELMYKYSHGERQNVEDKKFHDLIYEYSHNRVMQQLILSISDITSKLWNFPLNMEDPFTDTIPLHQELFNAIKNRNLKKALEINEMIVGKVYKDIQNQN